MRRTVVIILSIAILCSLFIGVFAVTNSNTEDMTTPSTVNPFEYAKAPDGIYVFIYHGSSPYMSVDIDTAECVVGRLYVYNSMTDSVIEISEQSVTAYTYTQSALYYVTEEQKIYKTDYSGTNHEYLYQCTQGDIDNLNSYFDALYFIEDQTTIKLLDVESKTTQEVWAYENLSWAIMLNADQLVAITAEEDNYLYDIPTNTATLISDIEATNLITTAVKGTVSNNARSTTPNFASMVTQENNVSFPVPGYNVVDYNSYPTFDRPVSWFHNNGLEGCNGGSNCKYYGGSKQCEGFARYAHDVYAHMENYNDMSRDAWYVDKCISTFDYPRLTKAEHAKEDASLDLKLFLDEYDVKDFFDPLKTGAYVRYGKYDDNDRYDGVHSIVLVAKDDLGIWAYECNQKYDGVSGHGCGVFLQYYTYANLTKYEYILHYVNHEYKATASEPLAYYNADYHKKGCANCAGYVCQAHTNISATIVSTTQHNAAFNCCGGNTATTAHTGTTSKSYYSALQHKVTATCCSGYVLATHTFQMDFSNRSVCTGCGYVKGSLVVAGL